MKKNISFYYGFDGNYERSVELLKEVGFDGVMALFERTPNFYKEIDLALNAGLEVESIHLPFRNVVNDLWLPTELGDFYFSQVIKGADYAKSIGVDKLTMHISSSPNPPPMSEIGFNRLLKIAEYYEKQGLTLCIENLRRLDYFWGVMNKMPESVKVCYDAGHHNIYYPNDFDVAECIERVALLHLHDNFGKTDDHFLPFEGTCDWVKICSRIAKMPLIKGITLEVHGSKDEDKLKDEYEYLRYVMDCAKRIEQMVGEYENE